MTVRELANIVRERRVAFASVFLACALGALLYGFLRPPTYTATSVLYVAAQNSDNANAAYQGTLLSQQRVASYVELVDGGRVAAEVARIVNDPDVDAIQRKISASSGSQTVLINVSASDRSPDEAARLANAVGEVFPGLVTDLERPVSRNGAPAVVVTVVEPAAPPVSPSSVGPLTTTLIGVLAGLLLGAGAALWQNAWDTSIKRSDKLFKLTGVANLAQIPLDESMGASSRIADFDTGGTGEAFRRLRTNLQFVAVDDTLQVLAVTSASQGDGKTTNASNLAGALAIAGHKVILVEADLRRPALGNYFGLEGSVGLSDILIGRIRAVDATQNLLGGKLKAITSGSRPPNPSELLGSSRMADLLQELRRSFDYVIVDTPPILPVIDAGTLSAHVDGYILVVKHGHTSQQQVIDSTAALRSVAANLIGTVLSGAPAKAGGYGTYGGYGASGEAGGDSNFVGSAVAEADASTDMVPSATMSTDRSGGRPSPRRRG